MTFPDAAPDPLDLSPRQRHILAVIREWVERYGYPPTVREIGAAVGLGSPSSVAHHLKVLQRRGLVRRAARGPRAVDARPSPGVDTPNDLELVPRNLLYPAIPADRAAILGRVVCVLGRP